MNQRQLSTVAAFALLLTLQPVYAAGPPAASFPERVDAPATSAERDERCAKLAASAQAGGERMSRQGPLSRLNILRKRHRSHERFVKEYCGQVTSAGVPLSHRAVATGHKPSVHNPDISDWPHPVHWYAGGHGGGHGDDGHGGGHSGGGHGASHHDSADDTHHEQESSSHH